MVDVGGGGLSFCAVGWLGGGIYVYLASILVGLGWVIGGEWIIAGTVTLPSSGPKCGKERRRDRRRLLCCCAHTHIWT